MLNHFPSFVSQRNEKDSRDIPGTISNDQVEQSLVTLIKPFQNIYENKKAIQTGCKK